MEATYPILQPIPPHLPIKAFRFYYLKPFPNLGLTPLFQQLSSCSCLHPLAPTVEHLLLFLTLCPTFLPKSRKPTLAHHSLKPHAYSFPLPRDKDLIHGIHLTHQHPHLCPTLLTPLAYPYPAFTQSYETSNLAIVSKPCSSK